MAALEGGQNNGWAATTLDLCGTSVTNVVPPNDVRICNGQLRESLNDDGGQATLAMYPKQPFDFAGRTGTITFDVTNDTQGIHSAWPEIWITDKPTPAPTNTNDPEFQALPANGLEVSFEGGATPGNWGQCNDNSNTLRSTVLRIDRISNYVRTELNVQNTDCVLAPSGPDGAPNHFEIRVSQNQVDVYGTDSGSTTLKHLGVAKNAGLTLTRGLVWMTDTHYNACKFNDQCVHTFTWDNFGFDGPVLARDLTFDVPDNAMPDLGFNAGATLTTLPMTAANISAAGAAFVLLNATHNDDPHTLTYVVNGHQLSMPWPANIGGYDQSAGLALPVPLADLLAGPNSVSVKGDVPLAIANVDILLAGAGGTVGPPTGNNPTPTPTASATTTAATPTATATKPPSSGSIAGTVLLEGRTSNAGAAVSASPGNVSVITAVDGTFTLSGLTPGQTYSLTASAKGYLSAARTGVAARSGVVTVPSVTLHAGDANGDGLINIVDISAIASDFGGPPSTGTTNLDGGATVNIVDVSLASTNYGLAGPTSW